MLVRQGSSVAAEFLVVTMTLTVSAAAGSVGCTVSTLASRCSTKAPNATHV